MEERKLLRILMLVRFVIFRLVLLGFACTIIVNAQEVYRSDETRSEGRLASNPIQNIDELILTKEVFIEADAFAKSSASVSENWIEDANSFAESLQNQIVIAGEILGEEYTKELELHNDDAQQPNATDILESVSNFSSHQKFNLTTNHNSQSSPAEVLYENIAVFVSFSMPKHSLKQLVVDAAKAGVPIYIRGFWNGSLAETVKFSSRLFDNSDAETQDKELLGGLLIDPRMFRIFQVDHVPTFLAFEGSLPDCDTLQCNVNMPEHDRLSGNISLKKALKTLANSGNVASEAVTLSLTRLEREF